MRMGMKKLTTIMAGVLCAAVMSTQAVPISATFGIPKPGAETVKGNPFTVTNSVETLGPDGLATFRLAYTINASSNVVACPFNPPAGLDGTWGIQGGGDDDAVQPGQWATIDNIQVIDFNANGGNLSTNDIQDLTFKVVYYDAAGNSASDSGLIAANGTSNTWVDINAGSQFAGHDPSGDGSVDLHLMTSSNSVDSFYMEGLGSKHRISDVTVVGDIVFSNSWLAVESASLSLNLNDPEVSTNGTIDASIILGSLANDIEIISTVTDDADFTADKDGAVLTSVNSNETITVTYNNSGDLVDGDDTDTSTLTITFTATGSGITNTIDVALDITYSKGAQPSSPELIIGWNVWTNSVNNEPASYTAGATGFADGNNGGVKIAPNSGSTDGTWGTLAVPPTAADPTTSFIRQTNNREYEILFTVTATGNRTILDSFHFDAYYNRSNGQKDWTLSVESGTISTGVVATGTIANNLTWTDVDVPLTGLVDRDLGIGGTAVFKLAWSGGTETTTAGHRTSTDNVGITARIPANSVLGIDPTALSLVLVDPDTSTNGTLNANFLMGTASNDVEIISASTDVAEFSAVLSGTALNPGNPTETITVTFDNSGGLLVNNQDTTNSTLSVEWAEVGSGVTNLTEVPLDVVLSKFGLSDLAIDRTMSTPNDRLRVAFVAGADSIELAVLDDTDTKLDFTAYDEHYAAGVRTIYTTKNPGVSELTSAGDDFTDSGFFSYITTWTQNIPVDNSGAASNVIELVDLVNPAWVHKNDSAETVVFIDLASISEISNIVSNEVLTIEVTATSGASTLTDEIDVTIKPDGTVNYTFVANGASFAETNGIVLGSEVGGSGNQFTGNYRHLLQSLGFSEDQNASGQVDDKVFGMYFDTDESGSFLLDNILLNLSTNSSLSPLIPADALLKLELWKINADLGDLSTTNAGATFPQPELVYTGTGVFPGTYNHDVLYMIDLSAANINLDADTRYGWSLRWNMAAPANLIIGVDRGPGNVGGSFSGNHLRYNNIGNAFPFYGTTDGGSGDLDIVFHLRSGDPSSFAAWIGGFGLDVEDQAWDDDPENGGLGDGYVNLLEYALGMDPSVADAGSKEFISTVNEGGTNYFEYVHDRRTDYVAQDLTYNLIDNTNLQYPTLSTNAQDEVVVGEAVGSYETVTNRYDTTAVPVRFVELEVQQN